MLTRALPVAVYKKTQTTHNPNLGQLSHSPFLAFSKVCCLPILPNCYLCGPLNSASLCSLKPAEQTRCGCVAERLWHWSAPCKCFYEHQLWVCCMPCTSAEISRCNRACQCKHPWVTGAQSTAECELLIWGMSLLDCGQISKAAAHPLLGYSVLLPFSVLKPCFKASRASK